MFKKIAVITIAAAPLSAFAALPTEVTGVFTSLTTDFTSILGLGFGLLAVTVGGTVLMGWAKRIPKKAA